MESFIDLIGIGAIVGLCIIYFVPVLLAHDRKHKNVAAIGILNLLLGWTIIGWIIALIWTVKNPNSVN